MKLISTLFFLGLAATGLNAADFSFTGSFTQDDNVQLFNFTVGATSDVVLRTWSYAGGTNAAGQVIPEGGFDPILALFDSDGLLVGQNDDGGGAVPGDSVTGSHFDTYLELTTLLPGTYTVSVMEYNNFANGPNLSDGFAETGNGNFTGPDYGCSNGSFCDVNAANRTANWAFDILGVQDAATTGAPEPATTALAGIGLALALFARRRYSRS